jgi:hypothetical protein
MKRILLSVAAVAVVACGQPAPQPAWPQSASPSAVGNERIYLGSASDQSTVGVVEAATGKIERTMPRGAPAPDWSRLYSVAANPGGVSLRLVDTLTGDVHRSLTVPSWVDGVHLSANGQWLALASNPDAAAAASRFQVSDATLQGKPVDVELKGSFTFDGLSGDGKRLYLLEWLSAGSYQVRQYDLAQRSLMPWVISDKGEIGKPMSGVAVSSLTSSDGLMQLTLYQHQKDGGAFVHVLPIGSADQQFAYCIDLPAPTQGWSLTGSPDAEHFYAVNLLSSSVVALSLSGTDPPGVRQETLRTPQSRWPGMVLDAAAREGPGRALAAVSLDGTRLLVSSGTGLASFDLRTWRPGPAAGLGGDQLRSLAVGRSGWVYAVSATGRLLRIDPVKTRVAWTSEPEFSGLEILHVG